jgi:integrase
VPTQAIINHAAEFELCATIRVKRFRAEKKVRKPVTLEWVQRFAQVASPHLGALAWFMFQTGARVSEAVAVRWSMTWISRRARSHRAEQDEIGAARSPASAETFTAIANQPRSRERIFLYATRMAAHKAWRTAIERAGIERLSFHSCRHGFATSLLQAKIDIVTVAKARRLAHAAPRS